MSDEVKKETKEKAFSAFDARVVNKNCMKRRKTAPNQAILEITREAEKNGFGLSYGKYVAKNKL